MTDPVGQTEASEPRCGFRHGEPLEDYFVTLTVRTTITAATMREAFEEAHSKLPREFELRRFEVEGKD